MAEELRGYRIVHAPRVLRHFSAQFEPLPAGVRGAPSSPEAETVCR